MAKASSCPGSVSMMILRVIRGASVPVKTLS
jgi:hypothetical protein